MPLITFFLSLCLITGHTVSADNTVGSEMVSCVMSVVNMYAHRRTVLLYSEEVRQSELWLLTARALRKPFMVVSQRQRLSDTVKLLVVLFPTLDSSYGLLLRHLRKDTKFVIVATDKFTRYHMTKILSQFHNMKMINDILLVPREDRIKIYTSFPFSENHCAGTGPPTKIDTYTRGRFVRNAHLFRTGKYWNMHGCTLTCLANKQPPDASLALTKDGEIVLQGLAEELMAVLSKKLNFKPKIVIPFEKNSTLDRSWFFYNDTIVKITEYLRTEQVDFAVGVFSRLAFTNDSAVVFGKETRFECYTWAVPIRAGKKRTVINNYIEEFTFSFWMLFSASFVAAVLVIVGITRLTGENAVLQSYLNAFFYIFSTTLNQPTVAKPRPWSLRVFVAHWLAYVLVITTAYQAALWSFMTIPWEVNNINSLQDLLDSPLEIGGAQQMINIIKSIKSNNENVKNMIKKFKVLPPTDFKDIINRIESNRDFAVFGEKNHLSSYSRDITKIFDTDKVYFIEDCQMQSLMTLLLFPTGSPLYEPVNTMLLRLIQNGLLQTFNTRVSQESVSDRQAASMQRQTQMTLTQCRGIFIILLFCYACCFIVFVFEVVLDNMSKKKRTFNVINGPKLYYPGLQI